jgi:uncharacterized protein YbcV (DUF1398 family)
MNANWEEQARDCLTGSGSGELTFPEALKMLREGGFDGYAVDLRRSTRTYYRPDGRVLELSTAPTPTQVAERFDAESLREAIREAQALVPGYTYEGFCIKAAIAGCAGYIVSLLGQRVLYYGRSGATHTEYFPGARPDTVE